MVMKFVRTWFFASVAICISTVIIYIYDKDNYVLLSTLAVCIVFVTIIFKVVKCK